MPRSRGRSGSTQAASSGSRCCRPRTSRPRSRRSTMRSASSSSLVQRLGMTAEVGLSWMFDTSLAALSLVYSGTLDACPKLQVVHPHAGGVLPYLRNRIVGIPEFHKKLQPVELERPVEQYFTDQFWADSVAP